MLAPLATLLIGLGTLALVGCNALATQFFLATPPRGERGVGLIVPFAALAVAGLMVALGSLLAAFRSGRPLTDAIPLPAPLVGGMTVVVTFGVVLAAFMAFAIWAEPVTLVPKGSVIRVFVGWSLGMVAPAILATVLLADLWMTPDSLRAHTLARILSRAAIWTFPLLAILGYGSLIALMAPSFSSRLARGWADHAKERTMQREFRERLRTSSLASLLREELDKLPSDAPFTAYSSYFVGSRVELDDECKALLVERALAIPDWNRQLELALTSRPYDDRWSAVEFVRQLPQATLMLHEAEFARGIELSLAEVADDIGRRPAWLTERYDRNVDPLGLVRSLLAAAKRFDGRAAQASIREAMEEIAQEAESLNRDSNWRKLKKELEAVGCIASPKSQEQENVT